MKYCLIIFFLLVNTSYLFAQTSDSLKTASLSVAEMVICKSVQNRIFTHVDSVFTLPIDKLFCYTSIVGAEDTTHVSHVWYFQGEETFRKRLNVKHKTWRTWSTKTIYDKMIGDWRVDVVDAEGSVIKSKEFIINLPESAEPH